MKVPLPREPAQGNSGHYGGVGSKPASKVWRPEVHAADEPAHYVPKRFARLRLRRSRRSRVQSTADAIPAPILFAMALVVGFIVLSVIALARS